MDTSDGGGGRDPDAGAGSSDGSGEILGLKGARAGADAALAGRFRYPEPVYHVVRGYPELQTQEAPAPSSRILTGTYRCKCSRWLRRWRRSVSRRAGSAEGPVQTQEPRSPMKSLHF